MDNPRKVIQPPEKAAWMAEEDYLRAGDRQPAFASLQKMLEGMKQGRMTPKRQLLVAGMHLDVASNPDIGKPVIDYHLGEAEEAIRAVSDLDLETIPLNQYRFALKARLLEAFLPRYRQKLADGVEPSVEDDAELLEKLLNIAGLTFAPANITPSNGDVLTATKVIRGIQFELGLHTLNARANVRDGAGYQMWPALPRQDSPHTYNFEIKEGIDALISDKGLFDPEAVKVQFKSTGAVDKYDPEILTIVGDRDLGTRFSGEIAQWAYRETNPASEQEKNAAALWLDQTENRLMNKVSDHVENTSKSLALHV